VRASPSRGRTPPGELTRSSPFATFECTLTDLNGESLGLSGIFTDDGSFEVEVDGG
jgi:hypothetical protein